MINNDLRLKPHRRYNSLSDEWVLISPQRTQRPWQGKKEDIKTKKLPDYDPDCYLCPRNIRANREKNPIYKNTFIFDNDFPALTSTCHCEDPGIKSGNEAISGNGNLHQNLMRKSCNHNLFQSESVSGICRVVCFSEKHNLTLANLDEKHIGEIIKTWIDQVKELSSNYRWVQLFENKGELMGCSNPHPHGQIWASDFVPNEIEKEDCQQKKYFKENNSILLMDYLSEELKNKDRVVWENDNWAVVVPFWAVWPFETLLLPKTNKTGLTNLSEEEIKDMAKIMKKLLGSYDRLFQTSMPYSMGWHFAPFNGKENSHWQLHAHYYPPLLRSATVKKFMVGYEMLAEAQRDITAEEAAERLRKLL